MTEQQAGAGRGRNLVDFVRDEFSQWAATRDTRPRMRWFAYAHLPEPLHNIGRNYAAMADYLLSRELGGDSQLQVALQHLLESRDAAFRAAIAAVTPTGVLVPGSPAVPERYGADLPERAPKHVPGVIQPGEAQ